MKAIDANILLRLIVGDDADQEARAQAMIASAPALVPLTVTLECEWVLRSFYKRSPGEIASALDGMTDVEGLVFEQVDGVRWALRRLVAGAGFADMVHIVQAAAAEATAFVTFDEGVRAEAGIATPLPVELPA